MAEKGDCVMKVTTLVLAGAAAALAISPAYAKPQKHGGDWRDSYVETGWNPPGLAGKTPPGLAKKPYGMPPGQAKKLHRYNTGQHLPRDYYVNRNYYVTDYNRYNLPVPPAGYQWVREGNDVYLTQTRTGLIANVIADLLK
jgi:Ni/Co efflux regulator RcnB